MLLLTIIRGVTFMSLQGYGLLKSQPIGYMVGRGTAHFEIHTVDEDTDYRIAINVKSQTNPPELKYIIFDDFHHEITNNLELLEKGFTPLESIPGGIAIDYLSLIHISEPTRPY